MSGVHVPSDIQESVRTKMRTRCYSLEPGDLGFQRSGAEGLEYGYDSFVWSFLPGPSLDVSYSKEVISSMSLRRRTYVVCITRHV